MKGKDLAVAGGLLLLAWHVLALIADAEQCRRNLARYKAAPTLPNFIKLALAEGALIRDLSLL